MHGRNGAARSRGGPCVRPHCNALLALWASGRAQGSPLHSLAGCAINELLLC